MDDQKLPPQQLVNLLADKSQRYETIVALVGGITSTELRHVTVSDAARQALIDGLQHPNSKVRWWCIQLMDHLADESYLEPLLHAAKTDPLPKNRRHAIHALTCEVCKPDGCALKTDVRSILADRVRNDPDWSVRLFALDELAERVDAQAIDDLLASLPGSDQPIAKALRQLRIVTGDLQAAASYVHTLPGAQGHTVQALLDAAADLAEAAAQMLIQPDSAGLQRRIQASQHHLAAAAEWGSGGKSGNLR